MYRVSEAVRSTRNQDGGVLLDIHLGQIFHLNPVGALIVEGLKVGRTEPEIASEIAGACGVGMETIQADVHAFLMDLETRGLARRVSAGKQA